jgi:ribosome assembly protein 1
MSSVSNVSGNSNNCSNISPLHLLNDFINSNPLSGDRCIPEEDRDIFMIWNKILLGIKEANNSGDNVDAEFQLGSDIESIDYRELLQRVISIGPKNIMSNIILLSKELTINVHSGSTLSRELYPTKDGSLDTSINSNESSTQVTSLNKSIKTGIFYKILQRLANAIASGFQLASYQGPLMHQPMHGIGFSIESIDISRLAIPFISDEEVDLPTNISSVDNMNTINMGQLIADVKYSLRISMLSLPTRVIEPIYSCDLQCDQSQLGNLYPVLAKRRGEIYKEDIIEGTSLFLISAYLPVSESFGFATELLKKTSGAATTPTLQFSQWRINSVDPFWKPTTIEELEDFGSDVAEPNIMRSYIDKVRKRKGLVVEEKVVASAEKQRTLTKNK